MTRKEQTKQKMTPMQRIDAEAERRRQELIAEMKAALSTPTLEKPKHLDSRDSFVKTVDILGDR